MSSKCVLCGSRQAGLIRAPFLDGEYICTSCILKKIDEQNARIKYLEELMPTPKLNECNICSACEYHGKFATLTFKEREANMLRLELRISQLQDKNEALAAELRIEKDANEFDASIFWGGG